MKISKALRIQLSRIFVDSLDKRSALRKIGIDINDELGARLQVLGGMAGQW